MSEDTNKDESAPFQWSKFGASSKSDLSSKIEALKDIAGGKTHINYRAANAKEVEAIKGAVDKATKDVQWVIGPTIDEAGKVGGPAGIWLVSQRVMGFMAIGASMALHALRTGSPEGDADDDLLFCSLLAYCAEREKKNGGKLGLNLIQRAKEMFKKQTGRDFKMPEDMDGMM